MLPGIFFQARYVYMKLVLAAVLSGIDRKGDGQIVADALSGDLPGESPDTGGALRILHAANLRMGYSQSVYESVRATTHLVVTQGNVVVGLRQTSSLSSQPVCPGQMLSVLGVWHTLQ